MKAFFRNMIQAYRGKCDGLVYYYNPRLNRIIARQYVKPRPSESTRRFAAVVKALKAIAPAEGYKSDLAVYVDLHNSKPENFEHRLQNWYNAYTRLMYALERTSPDYLDLEFITRSQIEANDLPCRTVKRAVEAGLLEPVKGYELLNNEM